jgi:hypothetical protein
MGMSEFCDRHKDVEAAGTCCSCGKPFREDCLVEGIENQYCKGLDCQARMARDDAVLAERNSRVEAHIEQSLKSMDIKEHALLGVLWLILAPLFAYFGSDGWTANIGVASAMGPLGALVLCMQLRALTAIYKRKYIARRRKELMSEWQQEKSLAGQP